jgi:hypothetical protein
MTASLLQLIAVGEQDKVLTGNPNISFFKRVYKRHTNFSLEQIPQYFTEKPDFGKKVSCIIDRRADLLNQIILEIELPALQTDVSWINGIGHHIIKYVELTIGGIQICKLTGEFIDIYSELTIPPGHTIGYYNMVGKHISYSKSTQINNLHLYIPIPFWFCRSISNSLPLVGMQYSEIKVNVSFREFNQCWFSGANMTTIPPKKEIINCLLYCDYIFLDTHERLKFAKSDHEYLIEQVQLNDNNQVIVNAGINNKRLFFNHPVKEFIWIYQANDVSITNDWGNFSNTLIENGVIFVPKTPFTKFQLKLNGQDRFESRSSEYFRLVQTYQRHTSSPVDFIYIYSFGLEPEKIQPTGTCNFSKIDSTEMVFEFVNGIKPGQIKVYGINYNILKIKNGMSGLMYSS